MKHREIIQNFITKTPLNSEIPKKTVKEKSREIIQKFLVGEHLKVAGINEENAGDDSVSLGNEEEIMQRIQELNGSEEEGTGEEEATTPFVPKIASKLAPVKNVFRNLKTPGGISLLLLIILFILVAIIPVKQDGTTRLSLFFLSLLGSTKLEGIDAPAPPAPTSAKDTVEKAVATTGTSAVESGAVPLVSGFTDLISATSLGGM